jgi:hypothetical protein
LTSAWGIVADFPNQPIQDFAVGVTGHRWNKISADAAPRIAGQLSTVFAEIEAGIRCEYQAELAIGGRVPVLRLVSNLAEGADQMAVASRPAGWLLHAILPFPRARYENDFAPAHATGGVDRRPDFKASLAQAVSIIELPEANDAVLSYERAGELMLQESDVLVAVWDGQPASGRGGTQAVIAQAIDAAIPVIWIRSDRDEIPVVLSAAAGSDRRPNVNSAEAPTVGRTVAMIVRKSRAELPPSPAEPRKA